MRNEKELMNELLDFFNIKEICYWCENNNNNVDICKKCENENTDYTNKWKFYKEDEKKLKKILKG